jgi:phage/plasmid primase-like uncharacterized protein
MVMRNDNEPLESPESQLRAQMRSNGIEPPATFVWDGLIHRFSPNGGNDDAGWYALHAEPYAAGAYGDWHQTTQQYNFLAKSGRTYTAQEVKESNRKIAELAKAREEEKKLYQQSVAVRCKELFDSLPLAQADHTYLSRKGVQPHFARLAHDGRLVVPLYDENGELSTVQYIPSEGTKLFHKGGATGGRFATLGKIDKKVFIAEGFATGATIYEETGIATVIAYSSHNLEPVAEIIRRQYPAVDMIFVADNDIDPDRPLKPNTGVEDAKKAQAKHGGMVIIPPIPGDVNDYRLTGGNVKELLLPDDAMSQKLKLVFGNELPESYEVPDEIIEDLIVSNSMTVIYGDSNSGKTFFALSLAMAVSEGVACYNRQVDQGIVLYLATEAPASIRARMQAIKKHHKRQLANLAMVPIPLNFHKDTTDANAIISLVDELERTKGQKVRMIIGDTLARMSSGANENSGEDMGPVMERFSMVAAHTGAAVVVIHHIGKDQAKGARGWSGMRAHIDTEIEVEDVGGIKTAKVTKQRELGSKGDEIKFKLEIVPMGISKFQKEVSTCVAVWDNDPTHQKMKVPQLKRIDMLKDMLNGLDLDPNDFPRVTRDQIKKYLMTRQNMSEENARKNLSEKDPSRFLGGLIADKAVHMSNGEMVVTYTFPEEAGRL